MVILPLFHVLFLLLFQGLVNAQDKPFITSQYFTNLPSKIFYFDDTTSILYHDGTDGEVHVSSDEGKTWFPAKGVDKGEAAAVIEHPFDNAVAFIIGRHEKHWRTRDRGQTWQSFTTPEKANFNDNPLAFHVDPQYAGHIIFHASYSGEKCTSHIFYQVCRENTYYTTDAFDSEVKPLLKDSTKCLFAHSSKDFKHDADPNFVLCIALDEVGSNGFYRYENSRIMTTTDYFETKTVEDLGIGQKRARGIMALAVLSKFAIVALKDLDRSSSDNMELFVTSDAKTWARAQFPHTSSSGLRENAYTLLQGTTHSLAIDVLLRMHNTVGTLFVSNSNGTFFTESLKNTNRSPRGFVDFEGVYGIEGVGIANIVDNADSIPMDGSGKKVRSVMTFDDGRSWNPIQAPEKDANGQVLCSGGGPDTCSLHLHSVTDSANFGRIFSSPAPGYVMGVGNAGYSLKDYGESGTFLSDDAGISWREISTGPTKYEFGGKGGVLVTVGDAGVVDSIRYSLDGGENWSEEKLPVGKKISPKGLLTVPDSTSLKFLLLGTISRGSATGAGNNIVYHIDFKAVGWRECDEGENSPDFEKWYARSSTGSECVMGHKQYYRRRKADAKCFVGHKFEDPKAIEEHCQCTDEDYECDYNFVKSKSKCVPAGPLPAGPDDCQKGEAGERFRGSSGYRKIPGNTCEGGVKKDEPQWRDCKDAQPVEGTVVHTIHDFSSIVVQNEFFTNSTTLLVRLMDNTVWQSANEGYSFTRIAEGEEILAFYIHPFSRDRAYLVSSGDKIYYTTDRGQNWHTFKPPTRANIFGIRALSFHPLETDYLIWTGIKSCGRGEKDCYAEAQYSTNNGHGWDVVEKYVRNCQWARDKELLVDSRRIMCESYKEKKGDQRLFRNVPLQLVIGSPYFQKKQTLFDNIVGFAKFSEYLLVAEYAQTNALDLQVSLDGKDFSTGLFPPAMRPDNHAYTILESSTDSVFLHLTTSDIRNAKFGNILKSNSNGTYYGLSIEHVSRNDEGYVDFEKMKLLEGIALINVVANPDEAGITGSKLLQTRITHNDGGTWKALNPPPTDSLGQQYQCSSTGCNLHIHGFTERFDARATFSSVALPGVMMGVGNVGQSLIPYKESDTFLSRDGGFTWEEIRKDAHLWEFGDSGSILVLVNDEEPTNKLLFSTDEGQSWREYDFQKTLRIKSLRNAPSDTSRKFVMFGHSPTSSSTWSAVHVDFTALTSKKCVLDLNNPENDDFELWSPAETRQEKCLFGRQTLYHRRIRDRNCFIGDTPLQNATVVENCECTAQDFECDYNYIRDSDRKCVLAEGATPLPRDTSWETCKGDADYWYERTAYRKIPHSTCEGGLDYHLGERHPCPGLKHHGFWFWAFMALIALALTALFSLWWRRSPYYRGSIRLPDRADGTHQARFDDSGVLATIASIPWFVMGVAAAAWSKVEPLVQRLPFMGKTRARGRGGYRTVAIDEDAQVLRFEDER